MKTIHCIAGACLIFSTDCLTVRRANAEETLAAWQQTAAVSAPEAVQAAAADENHFYAIANAVVAKYDRRTGERLAMSTGEATHLNGGFFWQGKLLCAHLNYPKLPEKSDIKVLDVTTMLLTTFKDFGDFGGSLTWVVQYDGHWWCNFARYGDDNAKTFLVKFNEQWQEKARWTYPAVVIGDLGRYSLSGGVWRNDSLLVTDHDNRVLYELQLPKEGKVLEFIGKQAAPFTGQGIAHDPKIGGLVGIDRAKRQVVFAIPK